MMAAPRAAAEKVVRRSGHPPMRRLRRPARIVPWQREAGCLVRQRPEPGIPLSWTRPPSAPREPARPPGRDPGVPVRPRRRADEDAGRPRRRLEADVRRVPRETLGRQRHAVRPLRCRPRLRRVRRREAALRRRPLVPRLARHPAAGRRARRSRRRRDGALARRQEERARAGADPQSRRRGVRQLGALRPRRARRRAPARGRLVERKLPGRARRRRDRGAVRGADRRDRRRAGAPRGQAGAGYLPGRRAEARRRRGGGSRLRRRARGRRGRPCGSLRLRRRHRPGGPGRRPSPPRRRRRRRRPRGASRQPMISHPAFGVDPWCVRESSLDLDVLAQTESVFALANGHIGLRANLDEGEPYGLPGTYLNSFYELRPLPYAEAGYGYPESGQTIVNATNGKIIRLLVDDEPLDVRYGELLAHERELDLRAGVLRRLVEWRSAAGSAVRVRSTRLVSFAQRSAAAILYEVEPLAGPVRVVVQSELVANEPAPPRSPDPRAAAALEAPLVSEEFFDHAARVVLVHSTRASRLAMAAGMDHVLEGPPGTD